MNYNDSSPKKYKIQEMMKKLTKTEEAKMLKLIPKIIGKSINTFSSYASIKLNHKKEIPYHIVLKLEILFGLPRNGLSNLIITGSHYKDLI